MTQVLIILALLAGYGVFLLVKPDKPCRRCSGWGHKTKRRGKAACSRCKGTGRQFRLAAPLVHRGAALTVRYLRELRERDL